MDSKSCCLVLGTLKGYDPLVNVVLDDAEEFLPGKRTDWRLFYLCRSNCVHFSLCCLRFGEPRTSNHREAFPRAASL